MNFIISEASEHHLDDIIEMCQLHAAYEQLDYVEDGQKERLASDILGENPALFCLLALEGKNVIGYLTFTFQYATWDAGHYAYMDCLFIKEGYRNKAIGQLLMNEMITKVKEKGCKTLQWHTPPFNEGAINFYHRQGATSKTKVRFFLNVNEYLIK